MYRKGSTGWFKHIDFILLDLLSLQAAFCISCIWRNGLINPYLDSLYRDMGIFLVLIDLIVIFCFETFKNVLKRGYYQEFAVTVKHVALVELASVFFLFTVQRGGEYSRIILYLTGISYLLLAYFLRILRKNSLRKRMKSGQGNRSILLVTTEDAVDEVLKNVKEYNYELLLLQGLVIIDRDLRGACIGGIPVVADGAAAADYVCREWVDEVFVVVPQQHPYPQELIDKFMETGVTVHVNLARATERPGRKQLVERIGKYTVLTTSINYATTRQVILKRMLDILGGLVGCLLTGLVFLFVAPMIYLKSPGPVFFSQERVGHNGKKFKMYKFRSMYLDAEERKKELLEQNRVKDSMMFKLDFDPRVIGNKLLPDGTKKTGIGEFIRRTSIDELPQFYNVLKGDMSLVGTRPPTIDEWEKYDLHHRARLATKPGITGMWQVSGRSNITDFEEVVKLDTQYIMEWSMGLDLRILFKTVGAVLKRDGSL